MNPSVMSHKNVTKLLIIMVSGVGCQSPGSKVQRLNNSEQMSEVGLDKTEESDR